MDKNKIRIFSHLHSKQQKRIYFLALVLKGIIKQKRLSTYVNTKFSYYLLSGLSTHMICYICLHLLKGWCSSFQALNISLFSYFSTQGSNKVAKIQLYCPTHRNMNNFFFVSRQYTKLLFGHKMFY